MQSRSRRVRRERERQAARRARHEARAAFAVTRPAVAHYMALAPADGQTWWRLVGPFWQVVDRFPRGETCSAAAREMNR